MKRTLIFASLVVAAAAALYLSQRTPHPTPATANAVLNMVADAQRDISRIPMHMTRISDEDEIRIGNELAAHYTAKIGKLDSKARAEQDYIRSIGARLAGRARRALPWRFHLIPDPALVNAFAVPGGHVFIGEGMLNLVMTEDELASVLAHEVEHIERYHCVERYQLEAQAKKLHIGALGELARIPFSLWEAGYSKAQEADADREGIFLAVAGGYSPAGAVTLLERFFKLEHEQTIRAQHPGEEIVELAINGLGGYFRSHPQPSERLAQTRAIIAQQHWEGRTQQTPFRLQYEVRAGED